MASAFCCEKLSRLLHGRRNFRVGLFVGIPRAYVSEPGRMAQDTAPRRELQNRAAPRAIALSVRNMSGAGASPGFFNQGVNDDAEIIVDRGNEIERGEDGSTG